MASAKFEDFNSVAVDKLEPQIHDCIVQNEGHRTADGQLLGMVVNFLEENITVTTVEQLGKGGFSHVYKARAANGQTYALKVSNKDLTEAEWKRLTEEVAIMQLMSRHPNVVHIVAAAKDDRKAYILMERCHYMTLTEVLQKRPLSRGEILWIGHALVSSIGYIHNKGCIHRDLKPSNLLFDFDGNLKVTDFGLSTRTTDNEPRKSVVGTAMYMVPEMATQVHRHFSKQRTEVINYGPEVDVWGIGIVLYAMMTGKLPYSDLAAQLKASGLAPREQQVQLLDAVAKMQWKWPNNYFGDTALTDLVEHILHREPKQRATLQEVLANPVWAGRPQMAPPTLMRLLSLLKEIKTPSRGGGGSYLSSGGGGGGGGGAHSNGASPLQNRGGSRGAASVLLSEGYSTPAAHRAKMTESEYFDCVADRIFEAEEDARADIHALHADALSVFTFIDAEITARVDIDDEQRLMRASFANLFKAKLPPALQDKFNKTFHGITTTLASVASAALPSYPQYPTLSNAVAPAPASNMSIYQRAASRQRQPSLAASEETLMVSSGSTMTTASALMTPNLRAQMGGGANQRGSSQAMFSGTFNVMISPDERPQQQKEGATTTGASSGAAVKMVRAPSTSGNSPTLYLEYSGRANSTKWNLRERVKIPEQVADMITPQHKCLNKHVMDVHHTVPSRFEGIYCNGCNKYFPHDTRKTVCLYRCNRCDFDICLACVTAQKDIGNLVECPTCQKKFVTKAKMNSHMASCRGPSTARVSASPARAGSSTPNGRSRKSAAGAADDASSPLGNSGRRSVLNNLPPAMTTAEKKRGAGLANNARSTSNAVTTAATPNNSFSAGDSASPDFRLSTNSLFEAANTRPTMYEFDEDDNPTPILVNTFVAGTDGAAGGSSRGRSSKRGAAAAANSAAKAAFAESDLPTVTTSAAAGSKRTRAQLMEIDDESIVVAGTLAPSSSSAATASAAAKKAAASSSSSRAAAAGARSTSRFEVSVAVDDTTRVFGDEDNAEEDGEKKNKSDGDSAASPKAPRGRRTEAPTPSSTARKGAPPMVDQQEEEEKEGPASPTSGRRKGAAAAAKSTPARTPTGMPSPNVGGGSNEAASPLSSSSSSSATKKGGGSTSKASPKGSSSRSISMPATGAGTINFNLQGADKPADVASEQQRQASSSVGRKQRTAQQTSVLNTAVSADDEKRKLEAQQQFRNAASVPPNMTGTSHRSVSPRMGGGGSAQRPPQNPMFAALPGLITSQPRIASLPNNANVINYSGGGGGGPIPPQQTPMSPPPPPESIRPSTMDGSGPVASRTGGPQHPKQSMAGQHGYAHHQSPSAMVAGAYSGGGGGGGGMYPQQHHQQQQQWYGQNPAPSVMGVGGGGYSSASPQPYSNQHYPYQQHQQQYYGGDQQHHQHMMAGGPPLPTGLPPSGGGGHHQQYQQQQMQGGGMYGAPFQPSTMSMASSSSSSATVQSRRLPAFLNLPQDPNNRQQFLDSFLVGPWVRTFSFARTDPSHLLYYSMQPGRYGCFFAVDEGTGTMVVDINSRMVLVVPKILQKDTLPKQCDNPHVTTFFDDDIYIITLQQAMEEYKPFVEGIVHYARKILEARAKDTVALDTFYSAHIYGPREASVPPQTKFTYIRRVFPDPSRTLTMFRLSNQRTQIVASAELEIRWQSDRANNVGMKYYVFADGRTSPMERDDYGILDRINVVLFNAYRK